MDLGHCCPARWHSEDYLTADVCNHRWEHLFGYYLIRVFDALLVLAKGVEPLSSGASNQRSDRLSYTSKFNKTYSWYCAILQHYFIYYFIVGCQDYLRSV